MTDDEVLAAVEERLVGVETRLRPQRIGSIAALSAPLLVGRRAGSNVRGVSPVVAVIAVAALALIGSMIRTTGVANEIGRGSLTTGSASTTPDGSTPPASGIVSAAPLPSKAFLDVLRSSKYDGSYLLIEHFGWGPCLVGADVFIIPPDGQAADEALNASGQATGFIDLPRGSRVWMGPDAESAAIGFGSPVLAIGFRGDTWIAQGNAGRQLTSFPTPAGRTMWILTGSERQCPGRTGPN